MAFINLLAIGVLALMLATGSLEAPIQEPKHHVCGHIDIRNNVSAGNLHKLVNCSIVNGSLSVVLIEHESSQKLDQISFPKLTEITDYLLIYRIKHVTTLRRWFPNLKYIRGRNLFEGNAIIIRDLPDLVHLGLHSLEHVRGGVRIEDTKSLCFDQTPDFHIIAEAIKSSTSNAINQNQTQLLPGFAFQSRHPNQLNAKWNHTPAINNESIHHFYIKLIEFQDLEPYYKAVEKWKCKPEDGNDWPDDDKMVCGNDRQTNYIFGRVDNYSPKDMLMEKESENILEWIQFKIYRSNRLSNLTDSSAHKRNDIKSKSEEKVWFDQKIHHVVGAVIAPLEGLSANISAVKWEDHVKHFQDYYVIVYGCYDKSDNNCIVVAYQKTRTAPIDTADSIADESVTQEVSKSDASVLLKWSEPERPNGQIISYQIVLQETKNKMNKRSFCVNGWQFRQSNGFVINDLKYNTEYAYKLRAVSLNGPPKTWTRDYNFTIEKIPESGGVVKWFIIGLCPVFVFLFLATFCYIKYPRKFDSQIDIVSVNPEYYSCQVDPMWEVDRNNLKLFDFIGEGNFGRVHYGELTVNDKKIKCAVKTLNNDTKGAQKGRENFLLEANIMKSFIDCHHIVKLTGIVSIDNPVYVLMEYMENGDLKSYLRRNRADSDENPNPRVPTLNRIFQMAIEISDGMAYLSARKFVHRDLAARNCLVAEDLTVKIGDFGMTRDIYDKDYYRKGGCDRIPVRWMAPEALSDGCFTTYTDIWAYGVVLFEIVTLGAQPYQGCANESVFRNVIRGMRLKEPDNCPKKLWRLMQFCWRKNPRLRPSFNEITEYLMPLSNQSFRDNCYYLKRKPFTPNHYSFKKMFYSIIPTEKLLLNATKDKDFCDNEDLQYCQMKPQIERKNTQLVAKDFTEQEIEFLNKLNDIKTKNEDQDETSWNIRKPDSGVDIDHIDCETKGGKEGKLIEC